MPDRTDNAPRPCVLIVDSDQPWMAELARAIEALGNVIVGIPDLTLAPFMLLAGGATALLLEARRLDVRELLLLRRCREAAPATALVVASTSPTAPEVRRALEAGATSFLPWPAPPEVLRQALRSAPPPEPHRGRRWS